MLGFRVQLDLGVLNWLYTSILPLIFAVKKHQVLHVNASRDTMCPDVRRKTCPTFSKSYQKRSQGSFYLKSDIFQNSPKS